MADFQVRRAQVRVLSEWAPQLKDGVPRVSKDKREGAPVPESSLGELEGRGQDG